MKECCTKKEKQCRDCESYLKVISNPPCRACVNKSHFTSIELMSDKNKPEPKESKHKPYEVGKFYIDNHQFCGTGKKVTCLGYTHQCRGGKAPDSCTCRGTGNVIMKKEDGTVYVGCLYNSANTNPIPYGRLLREWVDEPQHNWDAKEIADALKHITTFVEYIRTLHLGG